VIDKRVIIGEGTKIWNPELVNIYGEVEIGKNCNIGSFVEISGRVIIGDNVRIGAFCFIPEGVMIEDDCFIGPACVFTNDKYPPSKSKDQWLSTRVHKSAALGARCVILPGVIIGERAMVGAGTCVNKNVAPGWRVVGNPMRRIIMPVPLGGAIKEAV
jgi:UDP-2-acetamido-3-amino-2,3-dideoxy-glucuronate N-acetyltransferase